MKKWQIAASSVAAVWMLAAITFNFKIISSSLDQLADFGSFVASGIELKEGRNPYGTSSPLIFEANFPRVNSGGKLPNLNPPITLLVFEWLGEGDLALTMNLWRALSSLIYIGSILILANLYKPSILRILWTFALAGLWHTLGLGQIYTPLLLLVTLIWTHSLENKWGRVGIFLGLLTSIKPNFFIWVLLYIVAGNWRVAKASMLTILVTGLIPLFRMPPTVYRQWLEATNVDIRILTMPGNSSLIGLTSRLGYPEIGVALAALIFLAIAFDFYKKHASGQEIPSEYINTAGVLLCLLASPISWAGYTIFTIPIFLSQKKWKLLTIIAAAIMTVPFNFTMHFYYLGSFNFIFWGWWYGIGLGICLVTALIQWRENALT